MSEKLFEMFSEYLNKGSKLFSLNFYYDPLKEVNILYKSKISQKCLENFANKIENNSFLTEINIIPRDCEFNKEINGKLSEEILAINKALKFACKINEDELKGVLHTDKEFKGENRFFDEVVKRIDRKEVQKGKNTVVSVRSYLERIIGESLNNALYDLEVKRERFPERKELFTAKGSIIYISQYLLDHKQ